MIYRLTDSGLLEVHAKKLKEKINLETAHLDKLNEKITYYKNIEKIG